MPMTCILCDKKLQKIIFGRILPNFKRGRTSQNESNDVLVKIVEQQGKKEADQRILELETVWEKAFEMRSLHK